MRPLTYWAALLCICTVPVAAFAQNNSPEPYEAFVNTDDVYIRSGPGKNYYPTEKLNSGDTVEVYRQDPGGWLAIRPPQGSYSWVSGRYLRPLEKGLAVITGENVVSRVGSRFSNVRDVIQVRLERGEQVELLGEESVQGQTWYKIAPPSGEFRWISASYVSRELAAAGMSEPRSLTRLSAEPDLVPPDETYANEESAEPNSVKSQALSELDEEVNAARVAYERALRRASRQQASNEAELADGDEREPATHRVQQAAYEDPESTTGQQSASTARERDRTASLAPPVRPGGSWSTTGNRSAGTAQIPRRAAGQLNFAAELATLDLDLGAMISDGPATWNFDELYARLDILHDAAGTAIERGQVRELQTRLDRLEDIRRRHVALSSGKGVSGSLAGRTPSNTVEIGPRDLPAGQTGSLSAKSGPLSDTSAPLSDKSGSLADKNAATTLPMLGAAAGTATAPDAFDGQGVLRPVISKRRDAPRYALVDDAGNVASFVTPTPGLNLQPYVGHKVGMVGTRGFMQELRKPHVMAKRVSLLDQTTLK